jgi:hypothetical protein
MVIHRKVSKLMFSTAIENCFRLTGLTGLFGSPIICKSDRIK